MKERKKNIERNLGMPSDSKDTKQCRLLSQHHLLLHPQGSHAVQRNRNDISHCSALVGAYPLSWKPVGSYLVSQAPCNSCNPSDTCLPIGKGLPGSL